MIDTFSTISGTCFQQQSQPWECGITCSTLKKWNVYQSASTKKETKKSVFTRKMVKTNFRELLEELKRIKTKL